MFKDLGKKLHLDSGTLTSVVKKLESMELVTKYRTKEDDRVVIVEITEKGLTLKDKVLDIPKKMACASEMSEEEAVQFKYYLDKMLKKFS